MKRLFFLAATLVLLLSTPFISKADSEYNKVFDKEFAVKKSTSLYLKNKYGQINVENWDKNSISIHVEVTVENSNESKAKIMLDAINIVFSEDDDIVSAVTQFDEDIMNNNRRLFSSLSDQELSIDYKVLMPKYVGIDIVHKYGDIYMAEFTNKVRVELKYGNIKIQKLLRGDEDEINTLVLSYGAAEIGELGWAKIDVRYSNDIVIDKARALVVCSRYSGFKIGSVNSIVIDSKYDNFSIGPVANIVGESGYTSYDIEKLFSKFNLTTKYGDVKIKEVDDNFDNLTFNGSYTDFKAGIGSKASYNIDAKASYSSIKYYAQVTRVNRIEGNTSTEINGVVGEKTNPKAQVYIRTKYGNVNLVNF